MADVFVTNDFSPCLDAVDTVIVVAGTAEVLRMRPLVACYTNITTGLCHSKETLQNGPDVHFLDTDHTLTHFRERWDPDVFKRRNYECGGQRGDKIWG